MPKVYDPKPKDTELFLKLRAIGSGVVCVDLVNRAGGPYSTLLAIRDDGVRALPGVPADLAARAGFSPNALDANGRLKVIGQEVEAEKIKANYTCVRKSCDQFTIDGFDTTAACVAVREGGRVSWSVLSLADLRDLHARLGKHLAYVEKEGLE